ncbi:unnamed protein product [Angiostrongylus costaricensis]|uniref:Acetyltransf_18 domain-containing protein n=1 Tax=Angiostrongylus costaricensis TaxID=334426 RepID=A0A0R3PGU6_ANGCS|nr:unnamed protein product [Angiostrongylus costaricensis]
MFIAEDYTTWMKSFEKFWYYMCIDRDSQEAVGGVCMAFDRSASEEPEEDIYYEVEKAPKNLQFISVMKMTSLYASKYGFDKMPNYKHNFVAIPTDNVVIPTVVDSQYVIKDLKDVEEADVIAYDIAISRRSRAKYFVNFITTGKCFTKVALDTTGKIVGIGCVRAVYSNDLCAGPVFADSEAFSSYLVTICFQAFLISRVKPGALYVLLVERGHRTGNLLQMFQVIAASLLAEILLSIPDLRKYKMFASLYPAINENAARLFHSIGGTKAKIVPFTQCQFTKKIFPIDDIKVFAMTECACSVV